MKRIALFLVGCLAVLVVASGVFAQQSAPTKKPAAHSKTAKPQQDVAAEA